MKTAEHYANISLPATIVTAVMILPMAVIPSPWDSIPFGIGMVSAAVSLWALVMENRAKKEQS